MEIDNRNINDLIPETRCGPSFYSCQYLCWWRWVSERTSIGNWPTQFGVIILGFILQYKRLDDLSEVHSQKEGKLGSTGRAREVDIDRGFDKIKGFGQTR